jgi:hypothetical protein
MDPTGLTLDNSWWTQHGGVASIDEFVDYLTRTGLDDPASVRQAVADIVKRFKDHIQTADEGWFATPRNLISPSDPTYSTQEPVRMLANTVNVEPPITYNYVRFRPSLPPSVQCSHIVKEDVYDYVKVPVYRKVPKQEAGAVFGVVTTYETVREFQQVPVNHRVVNREAIDTGTITFTDEDTWECKAGNRKIVIRLLLTPTFVKTFEEFYTQDPGLAGKKRGR